MSIEKAIERVRQISWISKPLLEKYGDTFIFGSSYMIGKVIEILKKESVSPCENCQALETKIEQMKTDHALEQLDRNMAKDRNGN